jgi:ATP-binding cassette subfamily B protein
MSQPKKASYKVLIQFFLEQMGNLKKTFLLIVFQDCFNCLDSILWPFVLRWVIDIFTLYEANRYLALDSLKAPIFFSLGLLFLIEVNSRTMGFLMAKAVPKLQANIRMTMFDHIQRHSPSYFHER